MFNDNVVQIDPSLRLWLNNNAMFYETFTQFCRIKGCGGAGCPPPVIFERLKLPPKNYISSEREFIGESESFRKYFDFAIL